MIELNYGLKLYTRKEIDEKTGFIVNSYMICGISGPTYEQLRDYLKEEPRTIFTKLVYQQGPNLILKTENEMIILISNEMKSFEKEVIVELISKVELHIKIFKQKFVTEMNRLETVRNRIEKSRQELEKMKSNSKLIVESFKF